MHLEGVLELQAAGEEGDVAGFVGGDDAVGLGMGGGTLWAMWVSSEWWHLDVVTFSCLARRSHFRTVRSLLTE